MSSFSAIVMVVDARAMVQSVSQAITILTGFNPADLIGRPASDLIRPGPLAAWAGNVSGGDDPPRIPEQPWEFRHRDGRWLPLDIAGVTRLPAAGLSALALNVGAVPGRGSWDQLQSLTLATDQSPAAVIITDVTGNIRYVNRRFTEMTGYSAAEVEGRNPRILRSGRTPEATYRTLWETIAAGEVWRGELCNRRKDGELYWHSASISPMRNSAGEVTGFVAVQEDITERLRTLEALAASERSYRRIVDTAVEGIWEVDAEHRTTFVNQALATLLGYAPDEMIGRPVFDFTDQEGRVIAEASRRRRRQGIREQLEFKLKRRDGTPVWVLMSTGPILDDQGGYTGALAMVTDMSARRAAEQALRQSEAWFRALIEGAQDLITVLNPDGTIRYASPSYERGLGYRPDEMHGRLAFDLVHPDDREAVIAAFREAIGQAGSIRILQYRFRHADGSWRWIEGLGRNLIEDPVVQGAVVSGRDVTERRALEAQLRQAQKLEAVGQLVGGVAHDFNNILTVILGGAEALRLDLGEEHPGTADLLEIRKAGNRAAALTRQLLAFSRQQILLPRVLDLNDLVRNMEGMLVRLLRDDVVLETRLAGQVLPVIADPGQLEQVLLNLAVNSRDAMPGGGRLLIETGSVDVDEESARAHHPMTPGPHVVLAVTDTGVGMSPEAQAHAFEPFFTTKAPGEGTGLGLATVYGIVKQSDGFIWLYSEPGQGTTVKVYLPRAGETPTPVPGEAVEAGNLRGTEAVLLVEDNDEVRRLARRGLLRYGYRVLEARGPEAVELARQSQVAIDLLLTDVVMAGISGPELAASLCRERPDLAVLFTSGYADAPERLQLAKAAGAFLPKPFTVTQLAQKVREVLDRRGR